MQNTEAEVVQFSNFNAKSTIQNAYWNGEAGKGQVQRGS